MSRVQWENASTIIGPQDLNAKFELTEIINPELTMSSSSSSPGIAVASFCNIQPVAAAVDASDTGDSMPSTVNELPPWTQAACGEWKQKCRPCRHGNLQSETYIWGRRAQALAHGYQNRQRQLPLLLDRSSRAVDPIQGGSCWWCSRRPSCMPWCPKATTPASRRAERFPGLSDLSPWDSSGELGGRETGGSLRLRLKLRLLERVCHACLNSWAFGRPKGERGVSQCLCVLCSGCSAACP